MPKITKEQQASNGRVAAVRWNVSEAVAKTHDQYPGLTYDEVVEGLLIAAQSAMKHWRAGPPEEERRA